MGIHAVVYPKDRQSGLTPGMIQAASGAIHHIPLVCQQCGPSCKTVEKAGFWMYGADSNNGVPIDRCA